MKSMDSFASYGGSPFDKVAALSRKRADDLSVIEPEGAPDASARSWRTPDVVERDITASDFAPRMAMNASGQAISIWCRHKTGRVQLWYSGYAEETGWSKSEVMDTDAAMGISFPQIAMDAQGCAIAVWRRFVDPCSSIWANRFVPGRGWDRPSLLRMEDDGEVFDPRLAMNSQGDAMVVWQHSSATRNAVWSARYSAEAGGWGRPTIASSHNVSDASAPRVAMDAAGNAMVAWRQFDGVGTSIWVNLCEAGHSWGVADAIGVEQAGTAFDPQITMNAAGNAIVMWTQSGRQHSRIYACHYVMGMGWGRTTRIGAHNDNTALSPQVAMDQRGNAIAVWDERDGKRFKVFASRYVAGGVWGKPTRVDRRSTSDAGDAFDPKVAMDAQGNAVVVWQQVIGVRRGIWSNRYVLGLGWDEPAQLKSREGGDAFEPQIAMEEGGRAFAMWQEWSDRHFSVLANAFR